MIPLKVLLARRGIPGITIALILANFAVFLHELSLSSRSLELYMLHYGLVPARFSEALAGHPFTAGSLLLPVFTSMFLHGGWMHILGNMWFLWVFGGAVEDALGSAGYLALYLACGLGAAATQLIFSWGSRVPTIGASGAISAVMGAYLVLYPRSKVLTLVPLIVFFFTWRLPALFMIGYWFLIQFFSGLASLGGPQMGGTAFWAHVGGFLLGAIASAGARHRVAWYPT
ncbi:MAG TPA: rhomboid family intramembrane serine protease [Candidatus Acidoferrales bacterium]|nr:rhomboid family intramembrane serine protease [Candidatus Acidoferrales bacterium]